MIKFFSKYLKFKQNSQQQLVNFNHNKFWSRFFVFTITVLVILVLLSVWGANFLERIVNPVSFAKDSEVIVEIYPEISESRTNSKQHIVLDYLANNHNVTNFKVVTKPELTDLLNKWTSVLNDISTLPLPIIVNVSLSEKSGFRASDLQLALSQKVTDVYVESEKNLANKLTGSIDISRGLILLIPLILFFIVFGLVLFVTLGLVYSHKKTIEVLSFLGASYITVAKEFSVWVLINAFKGCFFGLIIAFIIVELFIIMLNVGWFVVPSFTTLWLIAAVVVLIPLEATIITFFIVRKVINWMVK